MRDLFGRGERLERKVADADSGIIVVELPYRPDLSDEAAQQLALEQCGLTPSDIGGRTVVFLTSFGA